MLGRPVPSRPDCLQAFAQVGSPMCYFGSPGDFDSERAQQLNSPLSFRRPARKRRGDCRNVERYGSEVWRLPEFARTVCRRLSSADLYRDVPGRLRHGESLCCIPPKPH